MTHSTEFDQYAEDYDTALAQGISLSGEDKTYFAHGRIMWLSAYLINHMEPIESVMDFGCGTGTATPYLIDLLGAKAVLGVDVSLKSLDVARQAHGTLPTSFQSLDQYQPCGLIDLAFCNGVFHHIPLDERAAAVNYVYRALRPGGWFSFWENNPWNPGARYSMSQCSFDRTAITLTPPTARRLLSVGGFDIHSTTFLFIFPRMLRCLRGSEPRLAHWPLGAQYQILCRKPTL